MSDRLSEVELSDLGPLLIAVVALRAARRAQPMYVPDDRTANRHHHILTLGRSLAFAEKCMQERQADSDLLSLANECDIAAYAAADLQVASNCDPASTAEAALNAHACAVAAHSVAAALRATYSALSNDLDGTVLAALDANSERSFRLQSDQAIALAAVRSDVRNMTKFCRLIPNFEDRALRGLAMLAARGVWPNVAPVAYLQNYERLIRELSVTSDPVGGKWRDAVKSTRPGWSAVTKDELHNLPATAVVAIALRAARRIFPLSRSFEAGIDSARATARAIGMAEHSMMNGAEPELSVGLLASKVASLAPNEDAQAVAEAAAHVFYSAFEACQPGRDQYSNADVLNHAADAVAIASRFVETEIRSDYQLALSLLQTVETSPFDATETGPFGPLWRHGTPAWYAELPPDWPRPYGPSSDVSLDIGEDSPELAKTLEVVLSVPDGVSEQDVINAIRQLGKALDQEHRRLGGHGLRLDTLDVRMAAHQEVPCG